ncbi:MAG: glycosyltransferase family 4 protein [Chloroflexi bacterium]|nr:glycosyltransferase family 4 protein [Chloroflexota bacterium]
MHIGIDYTAAARQQAGIGRYTRELIHALLKADTRNTYVAFAASGGLNSEAFDALLTLPARLRKVPLTDDWLARIWHRLRLPIPVETVTGPLDAFYSPDFVLPPTRPGTRTLLTVHDLSFLRYPDHFVPKLVRYLSEVVPRSIERADRVLADSRATKDDLTTYLNVAPGRVEVLYSGVDTRFTPTPGPNESDNIRKRYGLDERPIVLTVGTIQPRKNHARLIQAFATLGDDLQLAIGGGQGWLYDEVLQAVVQHSDRVRLLGFVSDADLPALYRSATLFVFPSFYEGFGLPVLEAMACGVPVVCSNTSSLPEVAGDSACLVNPHDTDALAYAMAQCLEDTQLRSTMVSKGLAQAQRFTWRKAAQQLLTIFDELG